ncbi:hypothetical protein V6N13_090922 [Hibiscus sabdariffa]
MAAVVVRGLRLERITLCLAYDLFTAAWSPTVGSRLSSYTVEPLPPHWCCLLARCRPGRSSTCMVGCIHAWLS